MSRNRNTQLKELFIKANHGDNKAYKTFLENIEKMAYQYTQGRISEKSHHQDIVQEILLSIHQSRHTYDPSKPINPWIYAIFHYRTADHLRKTYKNKEDSTDEETFKEIKDGFNVTKNTESNELINKALATLSKKQKEMVILSKIEGFTSAEIALKMNMNINTVKVTIHRSLEKMRKALS